MQLLVVTHYFWPEDFRINEIVREMAERGHQVVVLAGRPNYPQGLVYPDYARCPDDFRTYNNAEVLRLPTRPRGSDKFGLLLSYLSYVFWATFLGPWLLRGRKFDSILVFAPSPFTVTFPALALKWLKGSRLVVWVLDLWPETLEAVGVLKSNRLLGLVGWTCGYIYRKSDLVLGQSRSFENSVQHWARGRSRFEYFPAWVEKMFEAGQPAQSTDSATPPELLAHQGNFNIMFGGNLGEAQDLPTVVDAAAALKEQGVQVRWLLVGDGRAANAVRNRIAALELADTVYLLGRLPAERMPAFFAFADALLVSLRPSPVFAMTIPGKVQSYLATGKPILAMLDGEGARVIKDAGAGLTCKAGDAQALAETTKAMVKLTEAERRAMGRRGQEFARQQFDRETLIARLESRLLPG
jgi:colanic acid biosynthesis glycosyl transferase WcaI